MMHSFSRSGVIDTDEAAQHPRIKRSALMSELKQDLHVTTHWEMILVMISIEIMSCHL